MRTNAHSFLHVSAAALLTCAACRLVEPTLSQRATVPATDRVAEEPRIPPPTPEEQAAPVEPAPPRPHVGGPDRVKLELRGTTLAQAVRYIADTAGVNIVLDAGLDAQVDASFPSVTLDDALATLLARHDLLLVEDPPGIFHVDRGDSAPDEARFELRSARAADVEKRITALLDSSAVVVIDADQNFLHVRGSRADVRRAREFLQRADHLKPQVLIEMRLIEVTLGRHFELGIDHHYDNLDIGGGTLDLIQSLATGDDRFQVSLSSDDGDVGGVLNAIERLAGVELLSAPRVVAVNNSPARIDIVREVPYIKTTTATTSGTTGGVGTSTTQEVQFKEVGLKLKVTPAIRSGGVIELDVDQELSEVGDILAGVPAVDRRVITTRLEVRDGCTLAIGGLMQDRKSRADTGVPVLMDIPFLGRLFRNDDDQIDKRELVVFITPRVVRLDSAAELTSEFREVLLQRRREMGLDERDGGGSRP
ncbi:MAG: type II secretion system protein GspD [Planctomycetes bacterium]|nr:type II secretion system protein GspD [Planctomycetota bacterium]